MTPSISLTLKPLDPKPKLDATLAERSRGIPGIMPSRAFTPAEEMDVYADFDGDGRIDHFQLLVSASPTPQISCTASHCSLFVPHGVDGIAKLIPGDITQDGLVDIYLETTDGRAFALENMMDAPIRPLPSRDTYRTHLVKMAALTMGPKGWWDAVRKSIDLSTGLSHTWVAQEPKPRYPWLEGTPPHTDCVIDLERTLAELHAASDKFTDFQRYFNRIQKYQFNGPERTDFFTAEAVPHLTRLGMITDLTASLWAATSKAPLPTFQSTINKEAWFRAAHNGTPSGKNFPEWHVTLGYIPFESFLAIEDDGRLKIHPDIAATLPPVSIFVVMLKDNFVKASGTEIPDYHVGYMMKDAATGDITIRHSTPTSDMGVATVTDETVNSFFKTRLRKPVDGKLVPVLKTSVGLQVYGFVAPKAKGR